MFIFTTAIILVSFICLCFFKKKFWENRYLVLAISAGVALIATLATNYAIRGNFETERKVVKVEEMQIMYLIDSMLTNDCAFSITEDGDVRDILHGGDSTKVGRYSPYTFYYNDDNDLRIMYATDNDFKYVYWDNTYILPSNNDTIAYFAKERVCYENEPNRWVANFSLPNVKTLRCIYLPPEHYASIPDSLIRKIPEKHSLKVNIR